MIESSVHPRSTPSELVHARALTQVLRRSLEFPDGGPAGRAGDLALDLLRRIGGHGRFQRRLLEWGWDAGDPTQVLDWAMQPLPGYGHKDRQALVAAACGLLWHLSSFGPVIDGTMRARLRQIFGRDVVDVALLQAHLAPPADQWIDLDAPDLKEFVLRSGRRVLHLWLKKSGKQGLDWIFEEASGEGHKEAEALAIAQAVVAMTTGLRPEQPHHQGEP